MAQANCPICARLFDRPERYPKAICGYCRNSNIKDANGFTVTFQNVDEFGGFQSLHVGEGNQIIKKAEHVCYVNGYKCWASEGRFGGIMIEQMNQYENTN
jgi:hypothetical protein